MSEAIETEDTTEPDTLGSLLTRYRDLDDVVQEIGGDMFGRVRDLVHATGITERQAAEDFFTRHEVDWIVANGTPIADIKTFASGPRAGDFKTASYLPKAYLSARSVILKALEAGTALVDEDGEGLGKSDLARSSKTPAERAAAALKTLLKALGDMSPADRVIQCDAAASAIAQVRSAA